MPEVASWSPGPGPDAALIFNVKTTLFNAVVSLDLE